MSRDRSRPERTSEERERDRLERERRRAERAGAPPPDAPPPVEEPPGELAFEAPGSDLAAAEPLAPDRPPALEPAVEEEPVWDQGAVGEPPPAEDPGLAEPRVAAEPPFAEEPAPVDPRFAEAATGPEPVVAEPPIALDPTAAEETVAEDPAAGPEPHAHEPVVAEEPVAGEPAVAEVPVAEQPSLAEHAVTAEPVADDPATVGEPAPPEPGAVEPPVGEDPAEPDPWAADPEPAVPDPDAPEPAAAAPSRRRRRKDGYEIPGLPPADPPPDPEPLPEPPPRVRERSRRAAPAVMASGAGGGGGVPGAPGGVERRRPRRGGFSRLLALVALLAVAAVVVLLVHSLKGSSPRTRTPALKVVKVVIPEGKTRLQIAQIAKADGLTGSYRAAAKRSDLLNPAHYGAPSSTPTLEGFLFPATYDLDRGAPASRLVEEQVTAFQENFGAEDVSRAKALGVTPYELLTVASLIEREAQVPGDRAKIAAVIYNRLKAGMPIGIDAAIYYAVELQRNIPTYTHELSESQLQMSSPYNTRTRKGLPPTPISNPGTASIQAAAHPAHAAYLYYVAGADGCGEQVFSDTQAAFEKNVAAYEEAKRKNGGHPPACPKK